MSLLLLEARSQPSDHTTDTGLKGEGDFWHVKVGDKIAKDAAFTSRNPPSNGPKLEDYIAFAWNKMDDRGLIPSLTVVKTRIFSGTGFLTERYVTIFCTDLTNSSSVLPSWSFGGTSRPR